MKEETPLTIAIPTYNGGKVLAATLDRILPQLVDGVELLVNDNASEDETPEICAEYGKKYAFLTYHRNAENVGFDRNVDLAVRASRGRFVWIFADDDIMEDGAVKEVLSIARKNPEVCEIYVDSLRPYTVLEEDIITPPGDEFFRVTRFRCGGVTANVVNRGIWSGMNLDKYMNSGWIHMAYLAHAAIRHPAYIYRNSLKHEQPAEKRRSSNSSLHFMLNITCILRELFSLGYSAGLSREAMAMMRRGISQSLPSYKVAGLELHLEQLREYVSIFGNHPLFWLLDIPKYFIPKFIYRLLWRLKYPGSKAFWTT